MNASSLDRAAGAIVKVGKGRGFIVQGDRDRYVITTNYSLPFVSPCDPGSELWTFFIGGVENEASDILGECLFVDPIADIAVLGAPGNPEHWEAFSKFVWSRPPISVGDAKFESKALLLSPDGHWQSCSAGHNGGRLWISDAVNGIVGAMSGSPIMLDDRTAVGVVNCYEELKSTQGFSNARLAINLPGWLLQELKL